MKIKLYNYETTFEELRPALGLYYIFFNGNKTMLEKRNAYRSKVGFHTILDEGCYFLVELWIGNRTIGLELTFRPVKHDTNKY